MTLIKSISGIRGTIGGLKGSGLTPPDILEIITSYSKSLKDIYSDKKLKVVVGRDGRTSGIAISKLVCSSLQLCGINVIDLGLTTTPSTGIAVKWHKAHGGIVITASHNTEEWNALKLLNNMGEFISEKQGEALLSKSNFTDIKFPVHNDIGIYSTDHQSIEKHIKLILECPLVNIDAIKEAGLTVAFDGINSAGEIAIPILLKELGVSKIIPLYGEADGKFRHDPEPLQENLSEIIDLVKKSNADVGFVVDPDVDRLAIISEDGSFFGEEYTLVAVADYVLSLKKGTTVSNLSSSRALRDITEKHGAKHYASSVGEVNVVKMMKDKSAVIGGEGNGGVILPSIHFGRDALTGIALFLSYMTESSLKCSELRKKLPEYTIKKSKMTFSENTDIDKIFESVADHYKNYTINRSDGVKIDMPDGWIHIRKSNTEPIVRIYSEGKTAKKAESLVNDIIDKISNL